MSELLLPIHLIASIGSFFKEGVVDEGRLPQFVFLVSFLVTFGFIRTSAHLIRAQVPWWPGNVEVGGTHIHHLVWGICTVLIVGFVGVTFAPPSPWHEILAGLFGIGAGLTLDEFALWVNLRDVYWKKQGRASIKAVIVAGAIAGFAALGFRAWIDAADSVDTWIFQTGGVYLAIAILLGLLNVLKGKYGLAIASLAIPLLGAIGAVRLAKPGSVWAHRYDRSKARLAKKRFPGEAAKPFWTRIADRLRPVPGS